MDPLTLALSFATIVQLVGLFRSERPSENVDFQEFLAWTNANRHTQVFELLSNNAQVANATKSLLENQHDEVMRGIRQLNESIANVALGIDSFRPLIKAVGLNDALSEQAKSILSQMNQLSASKIADFGCGYQTIDGEQRRIQIPDARFVEDDLDCLVRHHALLKTRNHQGKAIYTITRLGAGLPSSCLLYTSPSPRDATLSRMPSSA